MKKIFLLLISFIHFLNSVNAQWQSTNGPTPSATVYCMASNSTNLFASVTDGVHSYAGTSWSFPANTGCPLSGIGNDINALFVSGNNLFSAFQTDAGVWVSPDSGTSWLPVYNGLPTMLGGQLYAVHALNSFGPAYPLFAGTETGVYSTLNGGSTWTPAGLSTEDIRCLATNGNQIFAGTYHHGVYYSGNNGSSWNHINNGLTDTTILSLLHVGGDTLFAGTINGIYKTVDNGTTWTNVSNGLPAAFSPEVVAIVKDGTTIIAGCRNAGVFTNSVNGNSWTVNNAGLFTWGVYSLTIKGANLYAGIGQGGVWMRALSELTALHETTTDNNRITIYPNPVSNFCTIHAKEISNSTLTIYDVTGRALLQQPFYAEATKDVSSFKQGIYVIEIKSKEALFTGKLIKE